MHDSSPTLQVNRLQQDVAHYERQAEDARQSSDSWRQTAHHLRADKEQHAAEVAGMQAEVRVLQCSAAFACVSSKPDCNACTAQLACAVLATSWSCRGHCQHPNYCNSWHVLLLQEAQLKRACWSQQVAYPVDLQSVHD